MNTPTDHQPISRTHLVFLITPCLLLPLIHFTTLASQVVIPREFFLYLYSVVFVAFLSQQDKLRYNLFFVLALSFLAWQAIALAWSSDPWAGTESVLNAYVFLLSAFTLNQIWDNRIRIFLLNSLIGSISLAAFIGILQNFEWNPLDLYQTAPPASTFNNKNLMASASLLFLPIAMSQLLTSEGQLQKTLFSFASACILSYILISHTKGVWLAGLCLLFIVLFTYIRSPDQERQIVRGRVTANRFYLSAIILVSAGLFSAPGLQDIDDFLNNEFSLSASSVTTRWGFYQDAMPLIRDHPIVGVGSGSLRHDFRAEPGGSYARQHAEDNKYLANLHNDHLQYIVEQGFVGLALWSSILLILYKSTHRQLRSGQSPFKQKLITYALLIGITGMLLHAMVSFPLRGVSTASLFWISVGLLFAFHDEQRWNHSFSIPRPLKHTLTSVLLAISFFAVVNVTNRAIASYNTKEAWDALTTGHCFAAKLYLNNLIETSKLDLQSAQVLALTYDYCGGESPEATRELMDQILTFEPNHAQALLIKGNLAYEAGEYDAAFDLYSHAQQVNPSEPRAYLGMAQIQAARGHLDTAAQLIEQALEINSEHKGARALLKQIKSRSFSPVPQGR